MSNINEDDNKNINEDGNKNINEDGNKEVNEDTNDNTKEKKLAVFEFVRQYNKMVNEAEKDKFIKEVVCTTYLPFEEKVTMCDLIFRSASLTEENGRMKLHKNSPAEYVLYCLQLIDHYTTVKVDFKQMLRDFNMLNKQGLIDKICEEIDEKELLECKTVFSMVKEDYRDNKFEIHNFIEEQIDRLVEITKGLSTPVKDIMQSILKDVDTGQLAEIMDFINAKNKQENKKNNNESEK